jgi:hypothetical protein
MIFFANGPWLIVLVAVAFFWSRRELRFLNRLSEFERMRLEEIQNLIKIHEGKIEAQQKAHADELEMIRNAKNLVWVRFSDKGEAYVCPGCGYHQKAGGAESN